MPARYSSVAVIGAGAAGISAVRALHEEQAFDTIRVFERRNSPGGTWNYDPIPQPFPDVTIRTAMYSWLDTNIPAGLMAFTHTPFPEVNSSLSKERYGAGNPTRPFHVVARYLSYLAEKYRASILLNTTVETVEKLSSGKWRLTLRRREVYADTAQDSWWQEEFDGVIIATGQYNVPLIPTIDGLDDVVKTHPRVLEHSNAFRSPEQYAGKRVVVVGGSFSAGDVVGDIHEVVRGPLYVSRGTSSPLATEVWNLPRVEQMPTIESIRGQDPSRVNITFSDGFELEGVDKIIFGTGYWLSFPFLSPSPVTATNRMSGFYQHLFKTGDPSLSIVGLARAPLSFRFMEYQSVAVARYYAGRGPELPSQTDQEEWEAERLALKGDCAEFHNLIYEMKDYMGFLRGLAGPPATGTAGYELPEVEDEWLEKWTMVFELKDQYWRRVRRGETPRANM